MKLSCADACPIFADLELRCAEDRSSTPSSDADACWEGKYAETMLVLRDSETTYAPNLRENGKHGGSESI